MATDLPTSTPAPTATRSPTSTPPPTLSPEAIAATETLIPDWLESGAELTSFLLSLKRYWPEASKLLENLEWVRDGISNHSAEFGSLEADVVSELRDSWRLGPTGRELVLAILNKPWMKDNVSAEEFHVVRHFGSLLQNSSGASKRLLSMPFLDSVDGKFESRMVNLLSNMVWSDTLALHRLLSRPVFANGITDGHAAEVYLIYYEGSMPEAVAEIRDLPWVQDGTDLTELEEVDGLLNLSGSSEVFFRAAMDSLGVWDGISPDELTLIQSIYWANVRLGWQDQDAVAAIEGLPWIVDGIVKTEWDGALALMNLGIEDISVFWSAIESGWVQDGITADEVELISSLA